MLDTLRSIVREVSAATDRDQALAIIVRRVKEAMGVDGCSVYLIDTAGSHYVLMATDGLNPAVVGKFRFGCNEGIVGFVGERQEPVNLENASDHPRFRYSPELGADPYHAFLGVPLIHFRRVLGVLVTRLRIRRLFTTDEVAFLVTIGAQLAGAINHATAGDAISRLLSEQPQPLPLVQGIAATPGVGIGTIVLCSPLSNLVSVPDREPQDIDAEEAAFRAAVVAVRKELRAGGERLAAALPTEARAVLDAYMTLLDGDHLITDTIKRVRAGNWAPGALRDTIAEYAQVFDQMEDPYLRARAEDIRGIGRRVLIRLQSYVRNPTRYPQSCILVGEEISIARIAEVPVGQLSGIVCTRGSVFSHAAILARALGIPAVMGIGDLPLGRLEGVNIVVDGYQGRIFINPSPAVLDEFQRLVREEEELSAELEALRDLPAETADCARVLLYSNVALLSDITPSLNNGAEGVGLYRTEFTFMMRDRFPSEDEQYQAYRKVLESFAPKPVTIRTLDVGGDKSLLYFPTDEHNSSLGWRGIRISLDHPELFLIQLRAMLRANAGLDNLQILFPMISSVDEVDEALGLLERAYQELQEEAQAAARPRVGAMIEVPSAVYLAEILAGRLDFLSIGTNDLTQYLLAVDRNNARVANLYESLHPAVIRAIYQTIQAAHQCAKPVSVCGEMAGDPAGVILLLGMGIDSLSMASPRLPRAKRVIRSFTQHHAHELLQEALGMSNATAIRSLLNGALRQAGLEMLVKAKHRKTMPVNAERLLLPV